MISGPDQPSSRIDEIERLARRSADIANKIGHTLAAMDTPQELAVRKDFDVAAYLRVLGSIRTELGELEDYSRSFSREGSGPPPPAHISIREKKSNRLDPLIFISHRHADKPIADVLNRHFQRWQVRSGAIFQSSSPRQGLSPGDHLTSELCAWLKKANLLIFVYTFADEDWSYCLWECGVATDPDKLRTRIVVFKCADELPRMYQDHLAVELDKESIWRFVYSFFKDTRFFAATNSGSTPDAFFSDIHDDVLATYADHLYLELQEVLRGRQSTKPRVHRLDFMRVSLLPEDVVKVRQLAEDRSAHEVIQNGLRITSDVSGLALLVFGYQQYEDGAKLSGLIKRWSEAHPGVDKSWIEDFCNEICYCLSNRPPHVTESSFRSVQEHPGGLVRPIITSYMQRPDGSYEFDVYLYRVREQRT